MSHWSIDAYESALRFAAEAHAGQSLPASELPYLVHLTQVVGEVVCALQIQQVPDPDLAVQCALLHDVLEDTPTPAEVVRKTFGDKVVAGVGALTKDKALPSKAEQMADSLDRIRQQPSEVWMVKMADRISNLGPPPSSWDADKCARYRREAETILDALGSASAPLSARLRERIRRYPPR